MLWQWPSLGPPCPDAFSQTQMSAMLVAFSDVAFTHHPSFAVSLEPDDDLEALPHVSHRRCIRGRGRHAC